MHNHGARTGSGTRTRRFRALAVCLLLSPWVAAADSGAWKSTHKQFRYEGIDGGEHAIRVYFPGGQVTGRKRPCFIFFHGGSWGGGSLAQGYGLCDYLAGRGMVAMTADYSMHKKGPDGKIALPGGESKKRICVIDGKTVIRWVRSRADALGVDADRIVLAGASAGGHIAVLSMMDDQYNNPQDRQDVTTTAQAFVLLCPAFTQPARGKMEDVSAFRHLDKRWPPTLVLAGEKDRWKWASDALVRELRKRQVPVQNWMAPQMGHMFFRKGKWDAVTRRGIDAFLVANGFLDGESPLQPAVDGAALVVVP